MAETKTTPLLSLTMTAEAAEHFLKALSWGATAADVRADEFHERGQKDREAMFRAHADWLRWGYSRLYNRLHVAAPGRDGA